MPDLSETPWIHVVGEREASPELQSMCDDMRDPRGHVDNILMIHSLNPPSLRAHYDLYRAVMAGSPELSRRQREMIAVVVSASNRCAY